VYTLHLEHIPSCSTADMAAFNTMRITLICLCGAPAPNREGTRYEVSITSSSGVVFVNAIVELADYCISFDHSLELAL